MSIETNQHSNSERGAEQSAKETDLFPFPNVEGTPVDELKEMGVSVVRFKYYPKEAMVKDFPYQGIHAWPVSNEWAPIFIDYYREYLPAVVENPTGTVYAVNYREADSYVTDTEVVSTVLGKFRVPKIVDKLPTIEKFDGKKHCVRGFVGIPEQFGNMGAKYWYEEEEDLRSLLEVDFDLPYQILIRPS